ncbi:MAG: DnaJ family domain-containing protein [Syntrophomonadaceae bacterium]
MNRHRQENERMQNIADKLADKKTKQAVPVEFQRAQYLARKHDLVGTLLAQAVERGEFDNLEGAGKPLNLEENPFEPVELRMVHKILKDNGFAPSWIELGKEIDALQGKFAAEVDYFKRYTLIVFSESRSAAAIRHYEARREDFYSRSQERLLEIYKKILDYNLNCPLQLGRTNIDVAQEMDRLRESMEALDPEHTSG